jgi:hypothetical protein
LAEPQFVTKYNIAFQLSTAPLTKKKIIEPDGFKVSMAMNYEH